jgi:hypothetical protein
MSSSDIESFEVEEIILIKENKHPFTCLYCTYDMSWIITSIHLWVHLCLIDH